MAPTTIDVLQAHALLKGGLLLSTTYKSNKHKVLWQCSKGHTWEAMWGHVKNKGSWCPQCSSYKTERLLREALSNRLGYELEKITFLHNGHKYQFDGYNKKHKIAFEYHGYQHYVYPNTFHKTEQAFIAAQQRDKEKEQYCISKKIKLIVIPFVNIDRHSEEKYNRSIINLVNELQIPKNLC